jgi:hypothetical protein
MEYLYSVDAHRGGPDKGVDKVLAVVALVTLVAAIEADDMRVAI